MERPKRAIGRNSVDLKWYERILVAVKVRRVSDTGTSAIPADLPDHGKCAEATSRTAARKTCVDMPINIDSQVRFLI